MWTRTELKSQAKTVLKASYWEGVVACLIYTAITAAASMILSWIPGLGVMIQLALMFFLFNPLMVGLYVFFMQSRQAPPVIGNIFHPFNGGAYMKIVGTMAWQYLFVFLWSLIPSTGIYILLIKAITYSFHYGISGNLPLLDTALISYIVVSMVIFLAGMILVLMKQISYSMTPYILTDNPNISYDRALKLSIAMTDGQKWRIFVLGLSFIGWVLLSLLTFMIGFIFLMPYTTATFTELYVRLRDTAIQAGLTTPEELNLIVASGPDQPPPPESL